VFPSIVIAEDAMPTGELTEYPGVIAIVAHPTGAW